MTAFTLKPGVPPETIADDDPRAEIRLGLIAMAVFAAIYLVGGALLPLDSAVVGAGAVSVAGSRQAVQHRDGGIVSQLLVKEGQQVKAGEVLMRVDATELEAQERVLSRQTLLARMQEARLSAELAGARKFERPAWMASLPERDKADGEAAYAAQRTEFRARGGTLSARYSVLDERSAQLDAEITGLDQQIEAAKKRIVLTQEQLDAMRVLYDKGFATLPKVSALEAAVAQLEGELAGYEAGRARAERAKSELGMQGRESAAGRVDDAAEALRQAQSDLFSLEPRLAAVRAQIERATIRAPVDGAVVGLTAFTIGGVVAPGQMLMEIVPDDATLVINAKIQPRDAENVVVGRPAEVRFHMAHSRRIPLIHGKVETLSADRLIDERTGGAYFEVQISVPKQELERLEARLGKDVRIRPGTPADVVLPVHGRTALGYLIDPLRDALWRSMREI